MQVAPEALRHLEPQVVYVVRALHFFAGELQYAGNGVAEERVSQVAYVPGLVGVHRGELHYCCALLFLPLSEFGILCRHFCKKL